VLVAPKGLLPSDTVGELINGAGTATSKTISGSVSGLSINHTSAELTATAKPELAPYGKASYNILNAMGELSYKSTDPYYPKAPQYPPYDNSSFNLPPWMYPTPYDNIDLTFSHVGTGSIKSGFVSKAQICGKAGANLGSYVWIAFTSSSYTLNQQALLLNNSDTVAVGLDNYIKAQIAAGGWNDFCASHCYLNP
jgi:ABC-type molybdate transport system substrate-binding protein